MANFTGTGNNNETIASWFVSATVTRNPAGSFPSAANDFADGWLGHDYIALGAGNDTLWGYDGNDTLYGEAGNDTLYGENDNDYMDGGAGDDYLNGGNGNDTMLGGGGSDTQFGGAGDDYIYSSFGTPETIDGGTGNDWLNNTTFDGAYFVDLASGATNFAGESFINMENVIMGDGNDTVWGTSGNNYIDTGVGNDSVLAGLGNDTVWGGTGNDWLGAGQGNDFVFGQDGNDTLQGGQGADSMYGGNGSDYYYVDNVLDYWEESTAGAAGGVDTVESSVDVSDLRANVEHLILTGTAITGGGNGLANTITGNGSNNTLLGFQGNDTIRGMAGNDSLVGGEQADVLIGGVGNDRFIFNLAAHSAGATVDRIIAGDGATAFQGAGAAAGDRIDLGAIDSNTVLAGNNAFIWGGTGIGRLSVVNDGNVSVVRGNTDNDGTFELLIRIEDGGVLANAYTAADFIL